jgi:hypothetical protein
MTNTLDIIIYQSSSLGNGNMPLELESFVLESLSYQNEDNLNSKRFESSNDLGADINTLKIFEDNQNHRYRLEFWFVFPQPGAQMLRVIEYYPMSRYSVELRLKEIES